MPEVMGQVAGQIVDDARSRAPSRWLWRIALVAGAIMMPGLASHAPAQEAKPRAVEPRAVVELFTSQGCSSCPAADKLLGELAKDPSLIAVSMPIDYWDYLGWKDTLANPKFSARQRGYAGERGDRKVYTPQIIVNGEAHALGSDRAAIDKAIGDTRARGGVMNVAVKASVEGNHVKISAADAGAGSPQAAEVWICGLRASVPVAIARGENSGRDVVYHNVVRRWLKVGDWNGKATSWSVPLENIRGEDVDGVVVYLQQGAWQKPGAMLGAAYAQLGPQ